MYEEKKLGDVCENLDSRRIPITKKDRVEGEIPYYGASGIVDYVKDFIFDEDLLLVSEDGANLLARTYPIAFSISGRTWVNNHAHALKFEEPITQKFIEYYLNLIPLKDFISGMAQPKLNQRSLNSIPVPCPPIPEQKRIVNILDQAFADIEKARVNAEQNLKNARELFENYLQQVFSERGEGWSSVLLGDEIELLTGFAFKSKEYVEHLDSVKLVRGDNIVQGRMRWEGVKLWPNEKIVDYEKYLLAKDDVVLAMDRTWVKAGMKYSKIAEVDLPCLLVQRVARLRSKPQLNTDYLFYLLGSKFFETYVLGIQTGLGVPHISGKQISAFTFQKPSIKKQEAIVSRVNKLAGKVKQLINIYERKLLALDELKKSILQKAFSGELTASTTIASKEQAA